MELEEVVVRRRRGATALTPERELDPAAIDAMGAYDIGEVIRRLTEGLGEGETPEIIVNGRPALISDLYMGFPPDALERVEVLPPPAGALYSDDPARRVVNIVLQPRFMSRDGAMAGTRPTAGGRSSVTFDLRQSEIDGDRVRQAGANVSRDTALRVGEREGFSQDRTGDGVATLRPATDLVSVNAALTGAVGDWSMALNSTLASRSTQLTAVSGSGVRETRQSGQDLVVSVATGGTLLGWSTRFNLDAGLGRSRQSGGFDLRARDTRFAFDIRADRPLLELPGGPARMQVGGRLSQTQSVIEVGGGRTRRALNAAGASGTLVLPVARSDGASGIGSVTLTLGGALRGVSGADPAEALSAAVNWAPRPGVRLDVAFSKAIDNPTDEQRAGPVVYGAPLTVFDFRAGEAVEILPLTGGNPDLRPQKAETLALSAFVGPFTPWRMSASLAFRQSRVTGQIGTFDLLAPDMEAAFPERFLRDVEGRLTGIDYRPFNLGVSQSQSLSTALNLELPVSRLDPQGRASAQLSIAHTLQLRNESALHPDLPLRDRLKGDGGGVARHQVSARADARLGHWGGSVAYRWTEAFRVRRLIGIDGPGDLRLDDLGIVDLRLSYQFQASGGEADARRRRYSGLRLELSIDNLFDSRPGATLGDGTPAPGYGRDDQDPLGRTVRVSLTRRF